jgi:hypothetical protein
LGLLIKVLLVIFSITLAINGLMILARRWTAVPERFRDRIQSPPFGFFATLYAFFLGFAIVTLWSNFVAVKYNVTWEAYSLLSSYRLSQALPNSEKFRQELLKYVNTVLEKEWSSMEEGSMNKEANLLIESVWNHLQELKPADKQDNPLFVNIATTLNEARRQRLSRGIALSGNIYQPIWVIIVFGLITTIYSLYFMHPEQNLIQLIFEFMVLFTLLACIYFIVDLDTPFSGLVRIAPEAFQEVYRSMQALQ